MAAHLDGRYPRVLQVGRLLGRGVVSKRGRVVRSRLIADAETDHTQPLKSQSQPPTATAQQRRAEAFSSIGDYGGAVADLQRLCEVLQHPDPAADSGVTGAGGNGNAAGQSASASSAAAAVVDVAALREARARLMEAEQKLAGRGAGGGGGAAPVDPYAVLGVGPAASGADVKAAYRYTGAGRGGTAVGRRDGGLLARRVVSCVQ